MFFAAGEAERDRYGLVLRCARYADRHGLEAVWVPERHYAELGCIYPNPALLCAALARETERIGLRAGSVVAGLHHPFRLAEDWAMADNLSGGRVGLSLAPGWGPVDFAVAPEAFVDRHQRVLDAVEQLRALWRGGTLPARCGRGEPVALRTYPTPLQAELPLWLTAANDPRSFESAGRLGTHLLTHMMDLGLEGLAERIGRYRRARAEAGHDPAAGRVAVMLHTFLGDDDAATRQAARAPFCAYLERNAGLLRGLASSRGIELEADALPAAERRELIGFLYERFAAERALIGSPARVAPLVGALGEAGVDEIACLLDFGPADGEILARLPQLLELPRDGAAPRRAVASAAAAPRDPAALRAGLSTRIEGDELYRRAEAQGAGLGPRFRAIRELWLGEASALARLELPPEPAHLGPQAVAVHASLMLPALFAPERAGALLLPSGLGRYRVRGPGREAAYAYLREVRVGADGSVEGDVELLDAAGRVLIEADGMRYEPAALAAPEPQRSAPAGDRRQAMAALASEERPAALASWLREALGRILAAEPAALSPAARLLDLGLDSLMAIELRAEAEAAFGVAPSVVRVLQGATIEQLAAELADALSAPAADRVALNAGGEQPPLFLVHPLGGSAAPYRELAAALEPRAVWGLERPTRRFESLTELAAHHVASLRELQPEGPYRLGGWSYGGAVAQEMAVQLLETGERVERLLLIDSPATAAELAALFELPPSAGEDLPQREALRRIYRERYAPAAGLPVSEPGFERFAADLALRLAHQPRRFEGEALLAQAAERPPGGEGWGGLLADVERLELPGDHFSALRGEAVARLADALHDRRARCAHGELS